MTDPASKKIPEESDEARAREERPAARAADPEKELQARRPALGERAAGRVQVLDDRGEAVREEQRARVPVARASGRDTQDAPFEGSDAGLVARSRSDAAPADKPVPKQVRRAVPLDGAGGLPPSTDHAAVRGRIDGFDKRAKARPRLRHLLVLLSFLLFVAGPIGISAWYLWNRAGDQFASQLGFLVQSEDSAMPVDALTGLVGGLTKSSSTNTDILFKFIQSQALVEKVDQRINLREVWSRNAEQDPVFAYRGGPSIEDLYAHWQRQVKLSYDQGTLDIRVLAYDPVDAQRIAQLIMDESQIKINEINDVSRQDRLRYAQEDLDRSLARLKEARNAVSTFRTQNQIIDPAAYATGQEGVLTTLQQQLAEALIQLGIVRSNAPSGDQRVDQAQLRVDVIREQIEAERARISGGGTVPANAGEAATTSDLFGRYEALEVDRQFSETVYTTALANYERARSEADRQSLYLAAYVLPTLAQIPEYPQRLRLMLILGGFLTLGWLVGVMIYYSIRDRR